VLPERAFSTIMAQVGFAFRDAAHAQRGVPAYRSRPDRQEPSLDALMPRPSQTLPGRMWGQHRPQRDPLLSTEEGSALSPIA